MKNHLLLISFIGLSVITSCSQKETQQNNAEEIKTENNEAPSLDQLRVKYQNKEMAVDLGVGLWAWPMPMDYDQDGDLDLVVSCPDVPFNGTYFFENPTGDAFPTFNPPVKIATGSKNLQISVFKRLQTVLFVFKLSLIIFKLSLFVFRLSSNCSRSLVR